MTPTILAAFASACAAYHEADASHPEEGDSAVLEVIHDTEVALSLLRAALYHDEGSARSVATR